MILFVLVCCVGLRLLLILFARASSESMPWFANEPVKCAGGLKPIFDRWLHDPDRLEFDRFDFVPFNGTDPTPPRVFNTFTGFAATRLDACDAAAVALFLELVDCLTGHEPDAARWMVRYLAHILQKPAQRQDVGVVFRGEEGVGKDSLVEIMEHIMGRSNGYVCRTSDQGKLFGRFNCSLENKMICQLNEATGSDALRFKELTRTRAERPMIEEMELGVEEPLLRVDIGVAKIKAHHSTTPRARRRAAGASLRSLLHPSSAERSPRRVEALSLAHQPTSRAPRVLHRGARSPAASPSFG